MLQPLLIEIGVEELPAIPLLKELPNIEKKWATVLEKYALLGEFEFYYTPRRLVLWHREFKEKQDDTFEELFGAPVAIAFKDGEPTKAAVGFAKKCGVALNDLSRAQKGGKEVLYYRKECKGRASQTLLNEMVNEWLQSLSFGKSMRWGELSESFIRPIRWIYAKLGHELVEIESYGVKSSYKTYPHRMVSFESIIIKDLHDYFKTLSENKVVLFQEERQNLIKKQFESIEKGQDVVIEMCEDLLNEVVAITEFPTALVGRFSDAFLELPEEVIITSMKEHQRYFPVRKNGALTNLFVVVSNAVCEDFTKVVEGNEKVLRARLSDAIFFWQNDLKRGLNSDGLEKILFKSGLGTLADKVEREHAISLIIHDIFKEKYKELDNEACIHRLNRAVEISKADLLSEMVYEFTELQGVMGYYYASKLGEEDAVALALKEQYLPSGEESALPTIPLGAILAITTRLDNLYGLFSIGEIPTGTRDPFALRRAVVGIIKIALHFKINLDFTELSHKLRAFYQSFDEAKLEEFILERIYQMYDVNPSVVKSVLTTGERNILRIDEKIKAVQLITQGDDYAQLSATFKRVANIIKDINTHEVETILPSLFELPQESALYEGYCEAISLERGFIEYLESLLKLKPLLDDYFDNVMVNAENEALRMNRKHTVALVYKAFYKVADIKEISV